VRYCATNRQGNAAYTAEQLNSVFKLIGIYSCLIVKDSHSALTQSHTTSMGHGPSSETKACPRVSQLSTFGGVRRFAILSQQPASGP